MVFHQFLPFVALTRLLGSCFRLQRLRLARLMGEFFELPDQAETGVYRSFCNFPLRGNFSGYRGLAYISVPLLLRPQVGVFHGFPPISSFRCAYTAFG